MNLLEIIILNFIVLIFPILLYLLYQTYSKTMNREKNEFYLDVAIISSFYLIICYGMYSTNLFSFLLISIPLIIAYLKKRNLSSIFLSTMIVFYYHTYLGFNVVLLVLEYVLYYVVFTFTKRSKVILWILSFVKILLFILQMYILKTSYGNFWHMCLAIFIFIIGTYFIIMLLHISENIVKLYKSIRELEEEKQIRESLFKITHEIKNPIAVCKGYLDMFDVNNIEHSRKYIPILKEEIKGVLTLLEDFLSITKIKVEKDIVDIYMLLEDVIEKFEPLLNDKKVKVVSHIPDEELYLLIDYNRMSQVFLNIIKNSIEAMSETKDGVIEIDCKEMKNKIEIDIKDNGCGISNENLKRMNEPFFTTKRNGTGLGVYLSREIIKEHGGSITYKSSKKGTTARVCLPREN